MGIALETLGATLGPVPIDRVALGAAIRAARDAAGLSQEKLAAELGFWDDRSNVSRVEAGQQSITIDQLWEVAAALNASVTAILVAAGVVEFDLSARDLLAVDPNLDEDDRKALLRTYDRLTR